MRAAVIVILERESILVELELRFHLRLSLLSTLPGHRSFRVLLYVSGDGWPLIAAATGLSCSVFESAGLALVVDRRGDAASVILLPSLLTKEVLFRERHEVLGLGLVQGKVGLGWYWLQRRHHGWHWVGLLVLIAHVVLLLVPWIRQCGMLAP